MIETSNQFSRFMLPVISSEEMFQKDREIIQKEKEILKIQIKSKKAITINTTKMLGEKIEKFKEKQKNVKVTTNKNLFTNLGKQNNKTKGWLNRFEKVAIALNIIGVSLVGLGLGTSYVAFIGVYTHIFPISPLLTGLALGGAAVSGIGGILLGAGELIKYLAKGILLENYIRNNNEFGKFIEGVQITKCANLKEGLEIVNLFEEAQKNIETSKAIEKEIQTLESKLQSL